MTRKKTMAKRAKIFLAPLVLAIVLIAGLFFHEHAIFRNILTVFFYSVAVFWLVAMFIDGLAQDIQDRRKR